VLPRKDSVAQRGRLEPCLDLGQSYQEGRAHIFPKNRWTSLQQDEPPRLKEPENGWVHRLLCRKWWTSDTQTAWTDSSAARVSANRWDANDAHGVRRRSLLEETAGIENRQRVQSRRNSESQAKGLTIGGRETKTTAIGWAKETGRRIESQRACLGWVLKQKCSWQSEWCVSGQSSRIWRPCNERAIRKQQSAAVWRTRFRRTAGRWWLWQWIGWRRRRFLGRRFWTDEHGRWTWDGHGHGSRAPWLNGWVAHSLWLGKWQRLRYARWQFRPRARIDAPRSPSGAAANRREQKARRVKTSANRRDWTETEPGRSNSWPWSSISN